MERVTKKLDRIKELASQKFNYVKDAVLTNKNHAGDAVVIGVPATLVYLGTGDPYLAIPCGLMAGGIDKMLTALEMHERIKYEMEKENKPHTI